MATVHPAGRQDYDRLTGTLEAGWHGVRGIAIVGEAGIGKTYLADATARVAAELGWTVAATTAVEHERSSSFAALAGPLAQALGASLPDLASDDPRCSSITRRHRLYDVIGSTLSDGSGDLLMVIDDLHWADPDSQRLICSLLQRPMERKILIAVVYRRALMLEADQRATLHMLERATKITITPRRLTRRESADLLGLPDGPQVQRMHQAGNGNPRYLLALARPEELTALVQREMALLTDRSSTVLQASALLGASFDSSLLPEITGLDQRTVDEAIDELLSHDLLEAMHLRRLRFSKPAFRRGVLATMPRATRRTLHAAAATELTRREASPTTIAPHVERVARHGDVAAVDVLRSAADIARWQDPRSAARWLCTASELVPGQESLQVAHASVLMTLGRLSEAQQALPHASLRGGGILNAHLRVLQSRPVHDVPNVVEPGIRLFDLVEVELLLGRYKSASQRLPALSELPPFVPNALQVAASLCLGERLAAEEAMARTGILLRTTTDADLAPYIGSIVWAGLGALHLDRLTIALEAAERGLAIIDAVGNELYRAPLLCLLSWAAPSPEDATATMAQARTAARLVGSPLYATLTHASPADLFSAAGIFCVREKPPASSALTRRELAVAELVADGATNRQIATALFLSERTVERHLSRIFTKLDISTRSSLAALVGARGTQWPLPSGRSGAAGPAIRAVGSPTAR
ncbi:helix-turn-helix transcriptional regulator [Kribbella albertanoniae]|nr:LuxR C-terminal-related transcriptional regulator [Kribbella albertanoniae]